MQSQKMNIFSPSHNKNDLIINHDFTLANSLHKDIPSLLRKSSARIFLNQRICYVTKQILDIAEIDIANPEYLEILMMILKKLPKQRFEEELEFIQKAFENIKFFGEIKKKMEFENYMDLFREITIQEFVTGQRIFSYGQTFPFYKPFDQYYLGDIGRKFYIILKGSVYILLKKQGIYPDLLQGSKKIEFRKINECENLKAQVLEITNDMNEEEKQEKVLGFVEGFFISRILKTGSSFGEIALETSEPRTATVLCREPTVVGVISKDAYDKFLSRINQDQIEENLKMLGSIDLFKHWNINDKRSFLMNLERKICKKNNLIYEENDIASHFYFIKEGDVEISISVSNEDLNDKHDDIIRINNEMNHFLKSKKSRKRIRLGILGSGQFFGELEIINNMKHRTERAICISHECVYFSIHKDKFFHTIKDSKTLEIMIKHSKIKKLWHENVFETFNKTYRIIEINLNQYKSNPNGLKNNDIENLKENDPVAIKKLLSRSLKKKTKEIGDIYYITNRKLSSKIQPTLSSFNVLNPDPAGANHIHHHSDPNKKNMVQLAKDSQDQSHLEFKGKFAKFLSSGVIDHMIEEKFKKIHDRKKSSNFNTEKEGGIINNNKRGLQLKIPNDKFNINNIKSTFLTPRNISSTIPHPTTTTTTTTNAANINNNNNTNGLLNEIHDSSRLQTARSVRKVDEKEIFKLYKSLKLNKIADILLKPYDLLAENGTTYVTSFISPRSLSISKGHSNGFGPSCLNQKQLSKGQETQQCFDTINS